MARSKEISALDALKSAPEKAYARLYKEHFGMVRHLVLNNSGSEHDAKDVFQDAMVGLFEMANKPGFKLSSKLSTLLYSIARNVWMKNLRGKTKSTPFKDFESHVAVEEYDIETDAKIDKMESAINTLGEPCKGILTSFYYLKKSMKEIAIDNGYKSTDHAKAQKYKCLQRLKKLAA